MRRSSMVLAGLGVAAVAALAWVSYRPEPVPVDLAEITRGEMQITVNADGKTRIRDIYEVAAPIAGQAQRSPVAVGDSVIAGETVVAIVQPTAPALLDARSRQQAEAAIQEAEAALQVARADVRKAEEDLSYANTQYDRTRQLVERGVSSLTVLEDVEQRRRIAEAALEAALSSQAMAASSLDRARAELVEPAFDGVGAANEDCCVEIRSPVDGVVLTIETVSERPVQAGQALLSVGAPSDLEIVADLLSSDAVRIEEGARAIVERWGGPNALEARVRRIEPSAHTKVSALGIEEQRVDVLFDLVTPPDDRPSLGHGFAVYLRILEWEEDDVLTVPLSAAFRDNGEWFVFVAADGLAEKRAVTLGHRNGQVAEVLSGLEPGEQVVVHPNDRVADGVPIADRDTM
jgi:HlyD family secretion protein